MLDHGRTALVRVWKKIPLRLRQLSWKAARLVPPALEDRLLAAFAGRVYTPPPAPVTAPAAPVRLYVAPLNAAGQGYAWARAAERVEGVAARNMVAGSPFGFESDYDIPGYVYRSRAWGRSQRRALRGFSHLLIEAQKPLFPGLSTSFLDDVAWARQAGLVVATVCHGSDIRRPSSHAAREPWSPFLGGIYPSTAVLESVTARNLAALETLRDRGVPAFVSTADLLVDVPWATWLPVVVDPDIWHTDTVPLQRSVPVVVHAPSRATLKGTDAIEPVLRGLERDGVVEYRQATGLDRDGMRTLYRAADIVIDQLRLGIYGVATCEALAAGRVVVSYVSDQVRAAARDAAGQDLPVVQADADTLRGVLLGLLDDRDGARAVARDGPGFVRTLHDGRASARALHPFLTGDQLSRR